MGINDIEYVREEKMRSELLDERAVNFEGPNL